MMMSCSTNRRKRRALATLLGAWPAVVVVSLYVAPSYAQRAQGIDTSSAANASSPTQAMWNSAYSEGLRFAFPRSSRGGTSDGFQDDSQFYDDITRGTTAGLLVGSYHYARADLTGHTAADDAQHYLNHAGMYMKPGYLLPVFDLEAGNTTYDTPGLTAWGLSFINTIFNAKGIYPIVYASSSYNNDEVNAQLAWVNYSSTPKSNPLTFQWLARPGGDRVNGNPPAASNYPNPYGVWDPNFISRTNSRDPAVNPWVFWQQQGTTTDPSGIVVDYDAANGNIEFVKDFLVPALWTNAGSGDWSALDTNGRAGGNWNSGNLTWVSGNTATGPAPRLPNSLDWVKLQNSGGGTVTLSSGAQTVRKFYTQQPLDITGGSLTVGYVPGSGGKWDLPSEFNAALTLSSGASYSAHTTQVDGGGGTFNINGGTITFTDIQLASHASNSGKIVMGGSATFAQTGGAGTSVIRSTGSLAQAGSVTLSAGNQMFTVNNGSAGTDLNVRAAITGAGRLVKSGAGTMQLSTIDTYSGGTTITSGVLQIAADDRLGAVPGSAQPTNIILDGGTLRTGAQINSASLTNAGSGYTSFPTLSINGAGADVLAASANVLAGINSIAVTASGSGYVNQTPVSPPASNTAGTFVDIVGGGGAGATAYATVSGGVVTGITIANQGSGYTSMPTIHISATCLGASPNCVSGSGATANASGITLQSIALADGGFDYTTPTISLTGGGGSGATASATPSSNVTLNSNRGITLNPGGGTLYQTAGTTFTIGGPISSSGSGTLTKSGPGTLVLSGAGTYTGATTVSAGMLTVSGASASLGTGNVTVQGTSAGSALVIQSGVGNAIDDGATLNLLGGGTVGVADRGYADLGAGISESIGSLLLNGIAQANGITYGSTASSALFQSNEYFTGSGVVTVGLPGDFNNDGSVDASDYLTWRKSPSTFGGTPAGYDLWRANFGNPPGSGSGGGLGANGGAVPEPSSIALLMLGLAALAARRRGR